MRCSDPTVTDWWSELDPESVLIQPLASLSGGVNPLLTRPVLAVAAGVGTELLVCYSMKLIRFVGSDPVEPPNSGHRSSGFSGDLFAFAGRGLPGAGGCLHPSSKAFRTRDPDWVQTGSR